MSAQSGKINLHEKQQAFVNNSVDKAAYTGGRQSGKTTALMAVAAKWANDDCRVLFGAPSQRMCKEALDDIRGEL